MTHPVAIVRGCTHETFSYSRILVWCPGCESLKSLPIKGSGNMPGPSWGFDGNLTAPTLAPSIMTRYVRGPEHICHSFLRAGVWDFLDDCTHSLKGQKVPVVPLPGYLFDDPLGDE